MLFGSFWYFDFMWISSWFRFSFWGKDLATFRFLGTRRTSGGLNFTPFCISKDFNYQESKYCLAHAIYCFLVQTLVATWSDICETTTRLLQSHLKMYIFTPNWPLCKSAIKAILHLFVKFQLFWKFWGTFWKLSRGPEIPNFKNSSKSVNKNAIKRSRWGYSRLKKNLGGPREKNYFWYPENWKSLWISL